MRRKLAAVTALVVFVGIAGFVRFEQATAAAATTRASAGSGNWSDPATWAGGTVPQPGDSVTIAGGHAVTYDQNAPVLGGVTVGAGATLEFASDLGVSLQSTRNVVVEGTLRIRPASAGVVQTLRFSGVNEAAFVGGGMDPVASDVGLWVMGAGRLDIAGTPKTGWVRAAGDVPGGATSVALDRVPTGWQAGDDVVITPTEPPTVGSASFTGFDEAVLTSAGPTIGLSRATTRPHPVVNGRWSAEVANLSRNVLIEGEPGRKSHVFIRSSVPQVLNYAQLRHLGVEQVTGRYPLHLHMAGDGSRGSQVLGTVVRDAGHHAFVPHNSHGITYRDTVAYNITSDAYWWDPPPHSECPVPQCEPSASNDITYEHALAAKVLPGGSGPSTIRNSSRLAGFELSTGTGSRVIDSTAVGVQGNLNDSGFEWNEGSSSVWGFNTDNRTHNNKSDGIFDWQNSAGLHVLANFASYHNGLAGVDHGAYSNRYSFENATLYGNGRSALELHAVTGNGAATPLRFDNVVFDGGGISSALVWTSEHRFDGTTRAPILFLGSTFTSSPVAFRIGTGAQPAALDVVNPTISTPADIVFDPGSPAGNVIRLQPTTGQPSRITPAGRTNIAAFYPYSGTPPSTTAPPTTAPPTTTTNPTTTTSGATTTTTATTAPPAGTKYLSDLVPLQAANGLGPIERDRANGGSAAGDGGAIVLNDVPYSKGLGVNAYSEVEYNITGYQSFRADVGFDDSACASTARIEIALDGNAIAVPGPSSYTTTTATFALNINVAGKTRLKISVIPLSPASACDHFDWADARLVGTGTPSTTSTTAPPTTSPATTTTGSTTTTTTFNPSADTYAKDNALTTNFGTSTQIGVDGSPVTRPFLKFTVTTLSGRVTSAKLRLHVKNNVDGPSNTGGTLKTMSDLLWSELGVTWSALPAIDGPTVASLGAVSRNTWVTIDVTAAITGNGIYSFGMTSSSSNGAFYDSRETSKAPQLIVTTAP